MRLRPRLTRGVELAPYVGIRPSPSGRTVMIDVFHDLGTLVEYSYEGAAIAVEFPYLIEPSRLEALIQERGPEIAEDFKPGDTADLRNIPFPFEVAEELRAADIPVDERTLPSGPPPPEEYADDAEESEVCAALSLEIERNGPAMETAVVRLREGVPAYSYDFVGDGSEIVSYSYTGLALSIRLRDLQAGVLTGRLPCRREVTSALVAAGVPLSDPTDPARLRPCWTAYRRALPDPADPERLPSWLDTAGGPHGRLSVWLCDSRTIGDANGKRTYAATAVCGFPTGRTRYRWRSVLMTSRKGSTSLAFHFQKESGRYSSTRALKVLS